MSAPIEPTRRSAICYLCGQPLSTPISNDHVPPRQLYAHAVRGIHNPNLLTIPVHSFCNKSFQHDEDYFVSSLIPLARQSYAGRFLLEEQISKYHKGERIGLIEKVVSEFDRAPGGVLLPRGKIGKRFEGNRVKRIVLKIVRGLYYRAYGGYLPEDMISVVQIISPNERPPDHFPLLLGSKLGMGQYPGVFDYKMADANHIHYWAMLFWDAIIAIAAFHDPLCKCNDCRSRPMPE